MLRALAAGLIAGTITYFGLGADASQAHAQGMQRPSAVGGLTARAPDLLPIPSRIEHGVVSVRNAGSAASTPSVVTVNCHLPGQDGGCPEIPPAFVAAYANPAYPNRLVVNAPAILPGHVYNHHLAFWGAVAWPSGSYVFDFVADAGATNAETNEANNTGSHTWVVP
jgi:hypothetical protein